MTHAEDAVIVDFQALRPDGCVSLELNATRADLADKGLVLVDGQRLRAWEQWGAEVRTSEGTVRWNAEWGWGLEIAADELARLQVAGDDE